MAEYHVPALLQECIRGLNIKPEGIYVDVTYGGGGHSKEILTHLNKGYLVAFDQDSDALQNTIRQDNFLLIHSNYKYIKNFLQYHGFDRVDGILADLGISFHQVDEVSRGFSFRNDAKIDMRMNKTANKTAANVLNEYSEEELAKILRDYGELHNAKSIAKSIVAERKNKSVEKISQLIEVLEKFVPKKNENKFFAKVFQALRIEVNQEMEALKEFLESSGQVLNKKGRLVVISYHSIEDRLVKNYIKSGNTEGKIEKDIYGNFQSPFKQVNKKIITPTNEEIEKNPRSRSAKLRIAEKI